MVVKWKGTKFGAVGCYCIISRACFNPIAKVGNTFRAAVFHCLGIYILEA